MKPGKHLEKLLRLIHETIKDPQLTHVYSNYKIPNNSGQKRELDILIDTTLNGFNVKVAIECKDYSKSVPVEKVEAFNSKCNRIPEINKKVFVSSSGFQKDAVLAAKEFGIELIDFKVISPSIILSWFNLSQITDKFEFKLPARVFLYTDDVDFESPELSNNFLVYFRDNREPIEALKILSEIFSKHIIEYRAFLLYKFFESERKANIKYTLPFSANFKGIYLKYEDKEYNIQKIDVDIIAWFEEGPVRISESRDYVSQNNPSSIKTMTLDFDNTGETDLIFDENRHLHIFHTNPDGLTYKLKPLFLYDPETKSLKKV
jgi:hypothetical protein